MNKPTEPVQRVSVTDCNKILHTDLKASRVDEIFEQPSFQDCVITSNEIIQKSVITTETLSAMENNICKPPFRGFGMLCCIISGVIFSCNALLVKVIESNSALQLSASRCLMQYLILLPYTTYHWHYHSHDIIGPPGMTKFLVLRGFMGSSAGICLYQSVQRISLGDAVTLSFSNVIFAGCLGYCFLNESFSIVDGAMSVTAMAGIILIAEPTFLFGSFTEKDSGESIFGVFFGVAAGVLAGITFIVIRKIGRVTHASLNVLYYSLSGFVVAALFVLASKTFTFPCLHEVPFIFLLGITGMGAQIFMTIGLRFERANTFAVLRSFQIVFVFILQVRVNLQLISELY